MTTGVEMSNKDKSNMIYEQVGNFTKLKLTEMIIDKYKGKGLDNINSIEQMVDDILKILSLCGMKYHQELKEKFGQNE